MLVGIAGNVMKQNAISPPPRDASMATEEESGRAGRNFIRYSAASSMLVAADAPACCCYPHDSLRGDVVAICAQHVSTSTLVDAAAAISASARATMLPCFPA